MFINMFRSYTGNGIDEALIIKMMSDNRMEIIIGDETLTKEQLNATNDKINIFIDIDAILQSRNIEHDSKRKITVKFKDDLRVDLNRINEVTVYSSHPINELQLDMCAYKLNIDLHDSTYLRVRSYFNKAVIKAKYIVICGLDLNDIKKDDGQTTIKATRLDSEVYIHRDILAFHGYTNNLISGYESIKYSTMDNHIRADKNTYIYSDGMVFDVNTLEVYPLDKNSDLLKCIHSYISLVI